eukprot:1833023-Rhodomonas_salina.2
MLHALAHTCPSWVGGRSISAISVPPADFTWYPRIPARQILLYHTHRPVSYPHATPFRTKYPLLGQKKTGLKRRCIVYPGAIFGWYRFRPLWPAAIFDRVYLSGRRSIAEVSTGQEEWEE